MIPWLTRAHQDYWSNEDPPDTVRTWSFNGPDGLAQLTGPQTVTAQEPALFRASLTRVGLDHLALERFIATAHAFERGPEQITAYPTPVLTIVHLLQGRMHVQLPAQSLDVRAGQSIVLDSRQTISTMTDEEVWAEASVVDAGRITAALPAATVLLPQTALTESFTTFVHTFLGTVQPGQQVPGPTLSSAIAELQSAVIAQTHQDHRAD